MIGLIYNEISKVIAQRRFTVIIILLTVIAILSALIARAGHIAEGIPITAAQVLGNTLDGGAAQLLFPFLFAVIIGDIVAGELTGGTMKLLLIRPVSRWKIWLSKLIGAFIVSAAVVLYYGVCCYVALGASIGFGSFSAPDILVIPASSAGLVTLKVYSLEMASIFSVVSLFMLISTLVESGVAAVGICATVTVICSIIVPIITQLAPTIPRARWFEYAFFEHWQIAGHITDKFPADNWTITGSLVTIAVWSALFIASGIAVFKLKDVKG